MLHGYNFKIFIVINQNKRILIAFNTSDKIKQKLINKGYSLFKTFEDNIDIKKRQKIWNQVLFDE